MFFVHTNNPQTMQNLYNQTTETALYVFNTCKQCRNYTKCIQILIESYMLLLYFSSFCINNGAVFRSILQLCKILGPIFSYSKRFTDEFILQIYFVLIEVISDLKCFTFFYIYFFKISFLLICYLLKFKPFLSTLRSHIFQQKK